MPTISGFRKQKLEVGLAFRVSSRSIWYYHLWVLVRFIFSVTKRIERQENLKHDREHHRILDTANRSQPEKKGFD